MQVVKCWSRGMGEARSLRHSEAQLASSDSHSIPRLMVDGKEDSLHSAKPVPLGQELLFSFTLAGARESLEPAGFPSW